MKDTSIYLKCKPEWISEDYGLAAKENSDLSFLFHTLTLKGSLCETCKKCYPDDERSKYMILIASS